MRGAKGGGSMCVVCLFFTWHKSALVHYPPALLLTPLLSLCRRLCLLLNQVFRRLRHAGGKLSESLPVVTATKQAQGNHGERSGAGKENWEAGRGWVSDHKALAATKRTTSTPLTELSLGLQIDFPVRQMSAV